MYLVSTHTVLDNFWGILSIAARDETIHRNSRKNIYQEIKYKIFSAMMITKKATRKHDT